MSLRLLVGGGGGASDGGVGPHDGSCSVMDPDGRALAFAVIDSFLLFVLSVSASRSIVGGVMPASRSSMFSTIQVLYL